MPYICDAHLHLYPLYDLDLLFASACKNLTTLAHSAHQACAAADETPLVLICCLAERSDCHYFRKLSTREGQLGDYSFRALPSPEDGALIVALPDGSQLLIIAGRQIATRERLEILSLAADLDLPDGIPLIEAQREIIAAGGIPVLNWAPGKWSFRRGRIAASLLEQSRPDHLALCDTALRPSIWPQPSLMRRGELLGLRVLAGSDPLPLPGEEKYAGSYATYSSASFDLLRPISSFRRLLLEPAVAWQRIGKRPGAFTTARRLAALKHASSRRPAFP